jgi:hypothetical protein
MMDSRNKILPARGEVAARSADGGGVRPCTAAKGTAESPLHHRFAAVPLPTSGEE